MQPRHSASAGIKIFAFMLAFVVMSSVASAFYEPNPVVVVATASGVAVQGLPVSITNDRTLDKATGVTDTNGEYLYDWANSKNGFTIGDTFTIFVSDTTKKATFSGNFIGKVPFDFTGKYIISTCPEPIVCPEDTTPYSYDTCPTKEVIKEVPVEKIVYVNQTVEVPTPVEKTDWANFVVSGGVGMLLAFLALYYQAYRGKARVQVYEKYKRADGSYGYKWVTKFSRSA